MVKGLEGSSFFSLDEVWKWARRHPGALVMGAMLVAVLLAPRTKPSASPAEIEADETPLFI